MTDLGLLLPNPAGDPASLAVRAEELGYESVWLGELWGASSVVKLTEVACRTSEINVGSAILNVFSRSPAVLAMTALSIDDVSDGRFTLGVGTSTQKAVEDLHGMDWDRPVRRSHETVELVKSFLSGDGRVDYEGQLFETADFPALGRDVPVYHAALGPANRRVVARLCDGWIPHNIPFRDLPAAFDYVAEHAEDAGRDPDDIEVAPYVPAAVDDDGDAARDVVRGHIAYYVGNGKGYERAAAERFPDETARVAELWRGGDRREAVSAVTDGMVSALGVAGTPDEARDRLDEVLSVDVITRPLLTLPNNASESTKRRTIEALAPANR